MSRFFAPIGALVLVLSLLSSPAAAQDDTFDPSEPPRDASTFAAQPSPALSLSGTMFPALGVARVAGASRFQTAIAASQAGWPNGWPTVVIAPAADFQDALSASSLAGATHAPLLLATEQGLDRDTKAELDRLSPSRIYLVGGVTYSVVGDAREVTRDVEVIAEGNVFETSAAVARAAVEEGADPSTLVVASAMSFSDALTSSALAAGLRHPLVLVGAEGMAGWLGAQFESFGSTRTLVVGGTAAIPDDILSQVQGVTRLAGQTRYETAVAVADHLRAAGQTGPPVIVSGATFADGLAAGVLAANSHRAPLLLADTEVGTALGAWLARDQPAWVRIVGGEAAVTPLAACQLAAGDTRAWLCIEQVLVGQGYNTGTVDGNVDHQTVWAIYAFQKVAGLPVSGTFGEAEFAAMLTNPRPVVRYPDLEADRIEINLGQQLILVIRGGEVIHQLHTSTGKSSTPTVRGIFRVYEMRNYRQANHMYRPAFFHRGYAFHGYPEIPLYPASHGCARTYDGDMDFLWNYLYIGEQIATYL